MTGGKWAVYKTTPGGGKWTDEIVALETKYIIQTNAKYTNLDTTRLLRDFMKFVSRISAHATWLIDTQFPQSHRKTLQGLYHLCRCWEEDPER